MSHVSNETNAPFASQVKAAFEILPCATFLNINEELFVEQVYTDISDFAVNPVSIGENKSCMVSVFLLLFLSLKKYAYI